MQPMAGIVARVPNTPSSATYARQQRDFESFAIALIAFSHEIAFVQATFGSDPQ